MMRPAAVLHRKNSQVAGITKDARVDSASKVGKVVVNKAGSGLTSSSLGVQGSKLGQGSSGTGSSQPRQSKQVSFSGGGSSARPLSSGRVGTNGSTRGAANNAHQVLASMGGKKTVGLMNSDIYDELELTDDITFDKEIRV